jgi:serine/threonine protein kinase
MCTGKFPFENRSEAALIKKKSEFMPSRELLTVQSDFVIDLLQKMCHPKYDKRSSVKELLQLLQVDNDQLSEAIKSGTKEFSMGEPLQSTQNSYQPVYYQQSAETKQTHVQPQIPLQQTQPQYQSQQPLMDNLNNRTYYRSATQEDVISFARAKDNRQPGILMRKNSAASAHDVIPQQSVMNQPVEQQNTDQQQHNVLINMNNFTRVMRQ